MDDYSTASTHLARGQHLLLTLKNCAEDIVNDEVKLATLASQAVEVTGAKVLQIFSHRFSPQGVTVLLVLAESHASLHTYPEEKTVFWDCFTCGTSCRPALSQPILEKGLKAQVASSQLIERS